MSFAQELDEEGAIQIFRKGLKKRAIRGLKVYLERKQDEMVKAALSRKFAYLRRLKSVMKLLR